ncbi:MAG: DUF1217 domain-containing protein [Pseudomonadota bacterium]
MITTYTGYQNAVRDLPRTLEVVASDQQVSRETDYYLANIGSVKSIDDFINDDRLFNYAMKAHGLADMSYAKALIVKVLEGGTQEQDAFVNRMADARYRNFAESFDFASFGSATTSFSRAQDGVVDKYLRQQLEENAGASNEGVRLALYFERKAPELTSVEGILADRALSTVVRSALQIPDATAFLDIDKQVAMIEERLDIDDFSDPEKLDAFINRFVNLWDAANPVQDDVSRLFNGGGGFAVSTDLLLTIQTLR